jgi:hypothetical protein
MGVEMVATPWSWPWPSFKPPFRRQTPNLALVRSTNRPNDAARASQHCPTLPTILFRHSHHSSHSLHLNHAPGKVFGHNNTSRAVQWASPSPTTPHRLRLPSHPSFSSLVRSRLACTPDCRCRNPGRPDYHFLASAV